MAKDTITVLNDLIKISKDGKLGFMQAAEHIHDSELKRIFQEKASGCQHAIETLQRHITDLGSEVNDSGTMLGAMHRGWINVKSMITGDDNHAILAECERGEDVAKKVYKEALAENLPDDIRLTVQHQYDGVQANHDLIRDLRDRYAEKI